MLTVTKMNDLSNCLVKILHVPYKYDFTLTTAMRFIPVFMNEMSAVSAEVRGFYLRGINSGYKSYGFGAMDFAAAVIVIIIVASDLLQKTLQKKKREEKSGSVRAGANKD